MGTSPTIKNMCMNSYAMCAIFNTIYLYHALFTVPTLSVLL